MDRQGFNVNPTEWWHFSYKEWQQYPILNVKFEYVGHRRFSPLLNAVDL
jgi:zinc D-Ala-D-Ala dipeptidase